MSSMPQVFLLKGIEAFINRALKLDPVSRQKLGDLEGKRIWVETHSPHFGVCLLIENNRVYLHSEMDKHPHATIEADSAELLKLAIRSNAHFIGGPIKVNGDIQLIQQLHHIATHLDLDWETGLSRLIGDNFAQPLSLGVKQLFNFASRFSQSLLQNTGDYLKEEQEILPVQWEIDEFINDNRDLRSDIERLEARITRLQKRIPERTSSQEKP